MILIYMTLNFQCPNLPYIVISMYNRRLPKIGQKSAVYVLSRFSQSIALIHTGFGPLARGD